MNDEKSAWIKIEDITSTPWALHPVSSRSEATPLTSGDAQQAVRAANDSFRHHLWRSVRTFDPQKFLVQGEKR